MLFLDFLYDCEGNQFFNDNGCYCMLPCSLIEKKLQVTLRQVLSFFTGTEYPSPFGFDITTSVSFASTGDFLLASTYALQITLPTKHFDKVDEFRNKMLYTLQNHREFGLL